MHRDSLVQLDRLSIQYGTSRAVTDLCLAVDCGEIFGLLGPNGSGKSSTLAALAGILIPRQGHISIGSLNPTDHPLDYYRQIGFVPQELALYEELSVRRNLEFFGRIQGLCGKRLRDRITTCLESAHMIERADDLVGQLSGGMQRRVNLACAVLHDPKVLLLDEPTAALDPPTREILFQALSEFRKQGKCVILSTHHLEEAEQWCDRVGVLIDGQLKAVGRPDALLHALPGKAVIEGRLRRPATTQCERKVRQALTDEIRLEISGREMRLEAGCQARLGKALAILSELGLELESFRTPTAQWESLIGSTDGNESNGMPAILPYRKAEEVAWAA